MKYMLENKEYLEALEKNIRYKKEYIGNDTYKLYIKKNEIELLEQALQRLETLDKQRCGANVKKIIIDEFVPNKAIDNSNPSEALKMLKGIEYVADVLKDNHKIGSRNIANQEIKEMVERLNYRIPVIKDTLLKAQEQEKELKEVKADLTIELNNKKNAIEMFKQEKTLREKQEKVLKILKEKNVDIELLKRSKNWLDYYTRFKHRTGKDTELTDEEFDLLKRWLG